MPPIILAWYSHLVGMSSALKEAFNLVQSGGAGIVGRAGGSYEAEEGEEGLLGGAVAIPTMPYFARPSLTIA